MERRNVRDTPGNVIKWMVLVLNARLLVAAVGLKLGVVFADVSYQRQGPQEGPQQGPPDLQGTGQFEVSQ